MKGPWCDYITFLTQCEIVKTVTKVESDFIESSRELTTSHTASGVFERVLSETKSEAEQNADDTKDENEVAKTDMQKTINIIKMKKKKKGKRRILSFSSSSSSEELQTKDNDQKTKPALCKVSPKTFEHKNAVTENEKMINNTNAAQQKHKLYECSEVVSSDEEYTGKSILRKRIRLVSPSSPISSSMGAEESKHFDINHISDIDTKKDINLITKSDDIACINIDDTSTDASEKYSAASGETANAQILENDKSINQKNKLKITSDYKTITSIISVSYNKHLKKMETANSSKEQQDKKKDAQNDKLLNRKLLSIGRKVMSKAGLVSMSLLKHLQQKDLKIAWVAKRYSGGVKHAYPLGKEADYIRIQTKIQSVEENNLTGFQIFNISNDDFEYNNILPVPILNISDPNNMLKRFSLPVDTVPNLTCKRDPILGPIIEADAQSPNMSQPRPEEVIQSTSIVKSLETQENCTVLTQLLNANPVANPKQVPKKKTSLEFNSEKTVTDKVQISKTIDHDYEAFICLDSDEEQATTEPRLMMPIITSTTSLVDNGQVKVNEQSKPNIVSERKNETVIKTVVTQNNKSIPRIKCKPVSELMATNTHKNLQPNMVFIQDPVNQQQTQTFPALTVTLTPNAMVNMPFQMSSSMNDNVPVLLQNKSTETANQSKTTNANRSVTFLMHCPTLPNTLTTSPFLYIRQLMSYHKINFMEVNKKLNKEFICLIKFKLSVRQEVRSILLYLSLHGHGRDFCLKVRDKNNECINVETRPAFWEWEVLKAFQDDTVTSKTLDCVERFDSEFYKVTKLFLGLLKTVECKDSK
ncbi:hypothetical protein EVAR_11934_1 [Eumeta japonica]|uniref:Uncharacterized protein n=1 Tax=Eumeta variegata TaxID=151549 RepID=A0A4C1U670_EUMVA|nr:hypothetical protein EVAR_11934_1 [Eumeta japonica]